MINEEDIEQYNLFISNELRKGRCQEIITNVILYQL